MNAAEHTGYQHALVVGSSIWHAHVCMPATRTLKDVGQILNVVDFGENLIPYDLSLTLQNRLAQLCKTGSIPDTLLQLQARSIFALLLNLPSAIVRGCVTATSSGRACGITGNPVSPLKQTSWVEEDRVYCT